MDDRPSTVSKRKIFTLISLIDTVISSIILLIYFGFLPVDMSGWGIPRWSVGFLGGIWFMAAFGILVYQLTRTDVSE